jgi:hypothetical protein
MLQAAPQARTVRSSKLVTLRLDISLSGKVEPTMTTSEITELIDLTSVSLSRNGVDSGTDGPETNIVGSILMQLGVHVGEVRMSRMSSSPFQSFGSKLVLMLVTALSLVLLVSDL